MTTYHFDVSICGTAALAETAKSNAVCTPTFAMNRLLRAALLLACALLLVSSARAQVLSDTITVTGKITSGTDTSGVFGVPGANLAGDTITIVYNFGDTTGTVSESCPQGSCMSQISNATGNAKITVNSKSYPDPTLITVQRSVSGLNYYQLSVGDSSTTVAFQGRQNISATTATPDFDFRSAFSDSTSTDSALLTTTGTFSVDAGADNASATFKVSSVTQSAGNCSTVTGAALSINSTTTGTNPKQPNIQGGTQNIETILNLALSGYSSGNWYPVSFGDAYTKPFFYPQDGTLPSSSTGLGDITYQTQLTSGVVNDTITASVCGKNPSPGVPLYQFYPYLDSSNTQQFDIGESQVSDSDFTTSSGITAAEIETFFENVTSGGSFLQAFYLDNTGYGGWVKTTPTYAATDTWNGTDAKYCGNKGCPTKGDTGTYVASSVLSAAVGSGISPLLLVTKLQVEKSFNSMTSKPADSVLNWAMGCGPSPGTNFANQLTCSAGTFIKNYNLTPSEPYFFPITASNVNASIQYPTSSSATCVGNSLASGCVLVGLNIANKATYAQYTYTPFVETTTAISWGGVRLFELEWFKYSSNNWYQ